jgi:hypothetical protein
MITDNEANTNLIETAKIAVIGLDEHVAAWGGVDHGCQPATQARAGDNRALFDRRNPLTRAQFVAAWRAGAVPLEIYRHGYDRYIATYEMRQYRQGPRARRPLPKGAMASGQRQSASLKQASGIALVDMPTVAIAALKRVFILAGLRHRAFIATPRK